MKWKQSPVGPYLSRSATAHARMGVKVIRFTQIGEVALLSVALGCGGGSGAGGDGGRSDGALPDAALLVCEGDRWAASAGEVDAIAGCAVITGNLSITGNELLRAELPLLTKVDGFLSVWGNPVLTHAAFAKLETIRGKLDISFNAALTSLELPVIKAVNETAMPAPYDVIIRDNALTVCQVEAIREQLAASGFRGTASISEDRGECGQ
jgi:hypothetical protein